MKQLSLFEEIEKKESIKLEEWYGYYSLYTNTLVIDLYNKIPGKEYYKIRTETIITNKTPIKWLR